jgi:long-chain acyl-CoA synthetase
LTDWNATGFACVPSGFAVLFKTGGDKLGGFRKSLRYIEIGSAAMPLEHKRLLMSLLPETRICMHYGLTEASRSAFIEFHGAADRLDSIGKPSRGVQMRIVDANGGECATGQMGRMVIKSPAMMSGYWQDPEGTAQAFLGDYLITGDVGHRDADGFLYLDAREKELINVGGREVSPVEIEALLETHPAVAECACVGVPDPQGVTGMAVKAYLVARPGVEIPKSTGLAKHLRGKIEPYKMPRAFEWIPQLPHTASGKLQRSLLAEQGAAATCKDRETHCESS